MTDKVLVRINSDTHWYQLGLPDDSGDLDKPGLLAIPYSRIEWLGSDTTAVFLEVTLADDVPNGVQMLVTAADGLLKGKK